MLARAALGLAPAPNSLVRATGIIRGRVTSTDGRALPHAQMTLFGQTDIMQSHVGSTDGDGRFEFLELAAGTLPVSVNGADVTDLVLQTSAGSSIIGRFTFATYNNSNRPAASAIELTPIPADFDLSPSRSATANIRSDWTFELAGINGPRRLQLLIAPTGWALKEIRVNGIDVTDRPLPFGRTDQSLTDVEVVLTDRVNQLNGTIADDRARPVPGSSVIVFSTDRGRWYPASRFLRRAVAGSEGAFTVAGLPFGSYYAAAVAQPPADGEDAWQDPEFLDSLASRASTVTLGDGQKVFLGLRLATR